MQCKIAKLLFAR